MSGRDRQSAPSRAHYSEEEVAAERKTNRERGEKKPCVSSKEELAREFLLPPADPELIPEHSRPPPARVPPPVQSELLPVKEENRRLSEVTLTPSRC